MTRTKVQAGDGKRKGKEEAVEATKVKKTVGKKKTVKKTRAPPGPKEDKRTGRQARAGLEISVNRCHTRMRNHWTGTGGVSSDAAVIQAAWLQWLSKRLLSGAADAAAVQGESTMINSAHVQSALSANKWLRNNRIVTGRVLGAAPIASRLGAAQAVPASGEGDDE